MTLKKRTAIFKALGHPARLRITDSLGSGERCVCDLVAVAGLGWSTVSRHLAVLKRAGIIDAERRGQQVFYRLRMVCLSDVTRCLDRAISTEGEAEVCSCLSHPGS